MYFSYNWATSPKQHKVAISKCRFFICPVLSSWCPSSVVYHLPHSMWMQRRRCLSALKRGDFHKRSVGHSGAGAWNLPSRPTRLGLPILLWPLTPGTSKAFLSFSLCLFIYTTHSKTERRPCEKNLSRSAYSEILKPTTLRCSDLLQGPVCKILIEARLPARFIFRVRSARLP